MPFIIYSKRCFKSILFLLILLSIPVLSFCYGKISSSAFKKAEIGIFYESNFRLNNIESETMNFVNYNDINKLKEDVGLGIIDSGFVFDKNFDEAYKNLDFINSIGVISSKTSVSLPVAKEFVFKAILESISDNIAQNYFDNNNIKIDAKKYYEKYLNSNDVFRISFEKVNAKNLPENKSKVSNFFIVFIIAAPFISSIKVIEDREKGIKKYGLLYIFCYLFYVFLAVILSLVILGLFSFNTFLLYVILSIVSGFISYIISLLNNKEIICGILPVAIILSLGVFVISLI
ncbi:MAG: hypothetical protein ACI4VF_02085 [Lachnospirales bacterium]